MHSEEERGGRYPRSLRRRARLASDLTCQSQHGFRCHSDLIESVTKSVFKSQFPHKIRQFILDISSKKGSVGGFVGGVDFLQNDAINTFCEIRVEEVSCVLLCPAVSRLFAGTRSNGGEDSPVGQNSFSGAGRGSLDQTGQIATGDTALSPAC